MIPFDFITVRPFEVRQSVVELQTFEYYCCSDKLAFRAFSFFFETAVFLVGNRTGTCEFGDFRASDKKARDVQINDSEQGR